jgi:hypothetical protein
MPRLTGGRPEESQVISHIREVERCDLPQALAIWEQIRRPSRKIVVFDRQDRSWIGWDHSNNETRDKAAAAITNNRIRKLETKVADLQAAFNQLVAFVNQR